MRMASAARFASMTGKTPPWEPLAEILEQRQEPTPGLKAKQRRLLENLASKQGAEPPELPTTWTPEQELDDGKFRRARVLQRLAALRTKSPRSK